LLPSELKVPELNTSEFKDEELPATMLLITLTLPLAFEIAPPLPLITLLFARVL
jgi:hypothetical protein